MAYNSFDQFIMKYQFELTSLDWRIISEKYELSEDMLRLFQNKLDWRKVAEFQNLSVDIIEEFINYQLSHYIDVICRFQLLSEDFIDKYKNIVDWEMILKHQSFSIDFYLKYSEEIHNFKETHKIDH